MMTQPSDSDIPHLLAELQSDNMQRRYAAVEAMAAARLDTPEVVNALKAAAGTDKSRYVREAALNALKALGPAVGDLKEYTAPPVVVKPLTRNEKIKAFAIGFIGWYLVNGLVALETPNPSPEYFIWWASCVFPVQVMGLIVLVFVQRWVAFGMLAAFALNFVVTLIFGFGFSGLFFRPFWIH